MIASVILALSGCVGPIVGSSPTPSRSVAPSSTPARNLTPVEAATLLRRTVTGAKPLLIPIGVPDDWRADIEANATTFRASYHSASGVKSLTLAIALANLPLPGASAVQTHPAFHGDMQSLYEVADSTNPVSARSLTWTESGTWSEPGPGGVPYVLSGTGVIDTEFWDFARSLHPNQI